MKNWLITILSLLLIATNIFWLLSAVETGYVLAYQEDSYRQLEDEKNIYQKISTSFLKNLSEDEVDALLSKLFKDKRTAKKYLNDNRK